MKKNRLLKRIEGIANSELQPDPRLCSSSLPVIKIKLCNLFKEKGKKREANPPRLFFYRATVHCAKRRFEISGSEDRS